jgi:hypothetical protein
MYASVLMIALRWYRNCKNPMVKDELLSTGFMLLMVGKSAEDEQVVIAEALISPTCGPYY